MVARQALSCSALNMLLVDNCIILEEHFLNANADIFQFALRRLDACLLFFASFGIEEDAHTQTMSLITWVKWF